MLALPVLEFVDATIVRGGVPVVAGLTLTIRQGEHTAIVGPNGAGKSSILRVLTLEDRPRASEHGVPALRLFGIDRWDVADLRLRMGVVTSELDSEFGRSTAGGRVPGVDVALSGLLGSHGVFAHHQVSAPMREQARAALERVEAGHLAGRLLSEMSAGERRRVLIARALVTRPDALVLDEPTAGLDFVARHRFLETVRRLAREGTTVILVTHHVDEIIPEVRRVVLLGRGRVRFDGSPGAVLTAERLSTVFGAELAVERRDGYYVVRHGSRLPDPAPEGRMAKYVKPASKAVASAMRRRKRGTLKSRSGRKVTNRTQRIAIELSEARAKGAKVPRTTAGRKRKARKSTKR